MRDSIKQECKGERNLPIRYASDRKSTTCQGSSVVEQRTHKPFVGSSNLPLGTNQEESLIVEKQSGFFIFQSELFRKSRLSNLLSKPGERQDKRIGSNIR